MADAWGIDPGWVDVDGEWHQAPPETIAALRVAMGGEPDQPAPPPGRPVWVVRPGGAEPLAEPCELVLEDGTSLGELTALPPAVPLGLHRLHPVDGGLEATLLVSPGVCVPPPGRAWGAAMQVPTTRSHGSWGVGDLRDVRSVAEWVASLGAGVLALSPLHAPAPGDHPAASPYYPSSRRWRSPLLLRVDDVAGAAGDAVVAGHARAARGLLERPIVDRVAAWRHQRAALEHLWAGLGDAARDDAERWRRAGGAVLDGWARYCAIAERHGPDWRRWPPALQHPDGPDVARVADERADRVAFHAWLQQLVDEQLAAAGAAGVALVQDLAIGADPGGADAWLLQDVLALGVHVGAPPDLLGPAGQDWGLPPFGPHALRDAGYRPLAGLLRAAMAGGGGVRIDHVMGLSRLFWIPPGGEPADGTYVRFAGRELLDVLAMESARAGAFVVGEDLGTVEPGFRDELAATGVLSTRVVWFEDDPPERYPERSLAMVTTHDLPTVAGVWTGADDDELGALGLGLAPEAVDELRRRLGDLTGLPPGAPADDVATAVHERLGRAASVLAVATLEDAVGTARRPNVPGTVDERPNWSLALPVAVDDLPSDPHVQRVLDALAVSRD